MAKKLYPASGSYPAEIIDYIKKLCIENRWKPAQALRVIAEAGMEKLEASEKEKARMRAGITQVDMSYFEPVPADAECREAAV